MSLLLSALLLGGAPPAGAEPPAAKQPPAQGAAKGAAPAQTRPAPAAPDGGTASSAKASPAVKGAPPAKAAAPPKDAAPKKQTVPLAPTKEELDRLRAAQKQEAEMGAGYGSKKLLRRPFPTSTGNTAGPGASQGAGTNQDRKAATLEAGGPTQGVRR